MEIAEAAESDELERLLARAGVRSESDDGTPLKRRKWSELRPFDRVDFDVDTYRKSLGNK